MARRYYEGFVPFVVEDTASPSVRRGAMRRATYAVFLWVMAQCPCYLSEPDLVRWARPPGLPSFCGGEPSLSYDTNIGVLTPLSFGQLLLCCSPIGKVRRAPVEVNSSRMPKNDSEVLPILVMFQMENVSIHQTHNLLCVTPWMVK